MALPRKGILLRLAIYIPLLLFFGWRALSHFFDQQATAETPPPPANRTYQLPDGRSVEVLELTPEEAKARFGVTPTFERGDPAAGTNEPPKTAPAEAARPEAGREAPDN